MDDFALLATAQQEPISTPPTIRRRDMARLLEEFATPPMLREAVSQLFIESLAARKPTADSADDDLLLGLASLWPQTAGDKAAATPETTPACPLPRFHVTPSLFAVTRGVSRKAAAASKTPPESDSEPAARQRQPAMAPREGTTGSPRDVTTEPPPRSPPSNPPPGEGTTDNPLDVAADQPPAPAAAERARKPPEAAVPAENRSVEDLSEADSLDIRKGASARLAEMEITLRSVPKLIQAQKDDPELKSIRSLLEEGQGETGNYVLDDSGLLWHAPRGGARATAVPHTLVPGVLALIHGTFGHPGIARTTILIERKFHWPTLKKDTREYVQSCRCIRRKRPWSAQLAMLPARFLRPMEVLEIDIQDMKVTSASNNRYLLVVVDRATKFLLAYPLPTKEALGVSRKLLELLLLFGLPLSIRCDPGSEFIAEVMRHLCRWLRVSLDFGPTNHPRAQGAVERLGGWLHGVLLGAVRFMANGGTTTCG